MKCWQNYRQATRYQLPPTQSFSVCLASIISSCIYLQSGLVKLVEPIIALIYMGHAAGPNHHKFTRYGCSVQYHFDSIVRSSRQALGEPPPVSNARLNLIVPPEKWEGGWKDKDGAQKRTEELLPKAVPTSPAIAEPVQFNSQAELVGTRKRLD